MAKRGIDPKELEIYIMGALEDALSKEGAEGTKDVFLEEIGYMYDEWTPTEYIRREDNGGFADERLIEQSIVTYGNSTHLSTINSAKPVDDEINDLDEIIEYGLYDYDINPGARPVYARTEDDLKSGLFEEFIMDGLKRQGINVRRR